MIFPEIVCSHQPIMHTWIFLLTATERWPRCDARWTFGKEWCDRLNATFFGWDLWITIGSGANPDPGRLSPLWRIRICKPCLPLSLFRVLYISTQAFQGQFTLPLAYQGVSKFAWQTLGERPNSWPTQSTCWHADRKCSLSHNWNHCRWTVRKYWNQWVFFLFVIQREWYSQNGQRSSISTSSKAG